MISNTLFAGRGVLGEHDVEGPGGSLLDDEVVLNLSPSIELEEAFLLVS